MSKTLTDAAVRKGKAAKDRREIADAACPGLYLVIQPSGAKSWALRYRRPEGRTAKLVLGSVYSKLPGAKEPDTEPVIGGHLTLRAAHRLVTALRHDIAMGRDPGVAHMAEREARRVAAVEGASNTFGAAAKDFIEQYASKKTRKWREQARLLGLRPEDLTPIPKGLAERWGARPIAGIDGHDIHGLVDETRRSGAPGLERRAEGPTESRARAMLSCLSRMFRWLVQHRRVAQNPCAGVHRPDPPQARDRVLSNAEVIKFWAAAEAERVEVSALLKLLLLTGCRRNEVAGMQRAELSDDGAVWSIPGSRTKNRKPHAVPLPPLAREILAGVAGAGGLVFTTTGKSPVDIGSKTKHRLDAAMAIPPWRIHDLRRTAATGMAELGIAPHIAPEKKAALERWADHIAGLVSGRAAKVVPIRGSAS
jgi:integrase